MLGPNMFVLWYEGTLHSGAKSRPVAEADDIDQAATLSPNIPSNINGRSNGETMLIFHRTDLRLFYISGRRPHHNLVDEFQGPDKQMAPAFIGL